jgi:hypothetical protein
MAYVGPGAGLDFVGYALTLGVYGVTAFSAVLLWPVYVLLQWIRGTKKKPANASDPSSEEARVQNRRDTEPQLVSQGPGSGAIA